jgi:hypothetical protein
VGSGSEWVRLKSAVRRPCLLLPIRPASRRLHHTVASHEDWDERKHGGEEGRSVRKQEIGCGCEAELQHVVMGSVADLTRCLPGPTGPPCDLV